MVPPKFHNSIKKVLICHSKCLSQKRVLMQKDPSVSSTKILWLIHQWWLYIKELLHSIKVNIITKLQFSIINHQCGRSLKLEKWSKVLRCAIFYSEKMNEFHKYWLFSHSLSVEIGREKTFGDIEIENGYKAYYYTSYSGESQFPVTALSRLCTVSQ